MEPRDDTYRLHYQAYDLDPDEHVEDSWVASVSVAGMPATGGTLVLTSKRLFFEPMKTPKKALVRIFSFLGYKSAAKGAEKVIDSTKLLEGWQVPLNSITSVEPIPGTRNELRISLTNGEAKTFLIFYKKFALVWSDANREARDNVIRRLQQK
jgi:hypothetical protein